MWAAASGLSVVRLVWQEAYECGEPTIDGEHRELFRLANALLDASFKAQTSPQAFSAALDELLGHIERHFAEEEALLAARGYPELDKHQRSHAELLARAAELRASVATGKVKFGDLVEFLANTVVAQHLFVLDRRYFYLFKKQAE